MKPTKDNILLLPVKEDKITAGGIVLPETKELPRKFNVINIGSKVSLVHVGQTVLVSKYNGTMIKVDGVEYKIVSEKYILAILEE